MPDSSLKARLRATARRTAAVLPFVARDGASYWRTRRFLAGAERWPAERIHDWQLRRLREVVRFAIEHTTGYRALYRDARIGPDDLRTLDDVRHLPFTTKEMLRDDLAAFTVPGGGEYLTTGGSTGIPFGFHLRRKDIAIERAFIHAGWRWRGWRRGEPSALLRGAWIGSERDVSSWDPYRRELFLSSYYLTAATVGRYVDELRARDIRVMQAYPSAMAQFCDLVREAGLADRVPLRLVLLGSENVYDWLLARVADVFPHAKVAAWYGHAEQAVLAPWCEQRQAYHAWPFYGITEVLDAADGVVAPGDEGEIVATALRPFPTPFLRYRTMDRAVRGPDACPDCGRAFPLLERLVGRAHEVIVTGTGRYISMTAVNMHDDLFDGLRQFQFLQVEPGRVEFRYISKAQALGADEEERIRVGLLAKLGGDVDLSLRPVAEIPRTPSGKHKFLEQRLEIRYGDTHV